MVQSSRRRPTESPQEIARVRRRHLWLLALITLFVYTGALPGHFLWSGQQNLVQGDMRVTSAKDVALLATHTLRPYEQRHDGGTTDLTGGTWSPLPVLANTLSWQLWHKCSLCWHLESLLWHLLAVIAGYTLGRELLRRHRNGNGLAFWAAALFAANTANVPAVAWLAARPELISGALAMASLALYSRLPATTRVPRHHVVRWLGGCGALALGAMLSNEASYVLPLLALLLAGTNAIQHHRGPLTGIPPLRLGAIGVLVLVLVCVLLYRALWVQGGLQFAGSYPTHQLIANLGTGLHHFWALIGQALIPGEAVLSDVWKITANWGINETLTLIGTLILLGVTLYGLSLGNPAAFGISWFLLWIAGGVGLFPTEYYHNELTLYPATWGMSFALVFLVSRAWRPVGRQLARGSEVILFLPLLAVIMTVSLASDSRWWNERTLYESETAADPYYFEGLLHLAHQALTQQRAADALRHLKIALEIHRSGKYAGYLDRAELYRLMGQAQLQLQLFDQASASLRNALKIRPSSATNWDLMGLAQIGAGHPADAVKSLHKADSLRPHDPGIRADLAQALIAQGDARGVPLLKAMLQRPGVGNFQRHYTLGKALMAQANYAQARSQLLAALKYRDAPDAHAALALALWHLGEHKRAQAQLAAARQSKRADPVYLKSVQHEIGGDQDHGSTSDAAAAKPLPTKPDLGTPRRSGTVPTQ